MMIILLVVHYDSGLVKFAQLEHLDHSSCDSIDIQRRLNTGKAAILD